MHKALKIKTLVVELKKIIFNYLYTYKTSNYWFFFFFFFFFLLVFSNFLNLCYSFSTG